LGGSIIKVASRKKIPQLERGFNLKLPQLERGPGGFKLAEPESPLPGGVHRGRDSSAGMLAGDSEPEGPAGLPAAAACAWISGISGIRIRDGVSGSLPDIPDSTQACGSPPPAATRSGAAACQRSAAAIHGNAESHRGSQHDSESRTAPNLNLRKPTGMRARA
jgi:hypothetical protein